MKLSLSPADLKLMQEVTDHEVLVPRVPRLKKVFEGIDEMAAIHGTMTQRGKYTGSGGWSEGRDFQKVAHIPTAVAYALLAIDPEILTDKKKFYGWLNSPAGRAYDLRRKTVKGLRK